MILFLSALSITGLMNKHKTDQRSYMIGIHPFAEFLCYESEKHEYAPEGATMVLREDELPELLATDLREASQLKEVR
jgi:hypothetical protein